jgi:hypothetical protein
LVVVIGSSPEEVLMTRYLVKTDYCDVLVTVTEHDGLSPKLLSLEVPTRDNTAGLELEVPLRAFSATMVEIIKIRGVDLPGVSDAIRDLIVREKAAENLKTIEHWARKRVRA